MLLTTRARTSIAGLAMAVVIGISATSAPATDYWVDALKGSDRGAGTRQSPWKTITYALTKAGAADIVKLLPGVYDAANGEQFPLKIPVGASIEGTIARDCIIDGGGNHGGQSVVQMNTNALVALVTIRGSNNGWWDAAVADWIGTSGWQVVCCTIEGNERGIHVWTGNSNVVIANCFFYRNRNDNVSVFASTNVSLHNNTFVGSLKGVIMTSNGSTASTGRLSNNIVVGATQAGLEADAASAAGVVLNNNDVWNNATNYRNLTASATDVSVDPQFIDAARKNYHLAPNSTLLDKGNAVYSHFVDWDGSTRPQGSGVDIGADEIAYSGATIADFVLHGQPGPGKAVDFVVLGLPNDAGLVAITVQGLGIPLQLSIGTLYLNLATFVLSAPVNLDARGAGRFTMTVPNAPALVGLTLLSQAYSGKRLTRTETIAIH